MELTYLGHASFKIKTKPAVLVTDPYPNAIGLKMPKVSADVVTVSHDHDDHREIKNVVASEGRKSPVLIEAPGEYEVGGISVFGIESFHDNQEGKERGKNNIYKIIAEEVSIIHLGDLGHTLTKRQVDRLGEVEVLLVPVGGVYTIGPKGALKVIEQLEPNVVVPMHYKRAGMASTFKDLSTVDDFLKEAGMEATKSKKLSVNKFSLPEDREVVVMD